MEKSVLTDDVQYSLDATKKTLEGKILEGAGTDDDARILTHLTLFRGDDNPRAAVFAGDARWLVVQAGMLASAFEATKLIFASDSFRATQLTNPEGKPWAHHEMQDRQHEPAVRALLQDCLTILVAKRADTGITLISQSYEIVQEVAVRWLEPDIFQTDRDSDKASGFMPEHLVKAIHEEHLSEIMSRTTGKTIAELESEYSMTPAERLVHQELAALRRVMEVARQSDASVSFVLFYSEEAELAIAQASLAGIPDLKIEISNAKD